MKYGDNGTESLDYNCIKGGLVGAKIGGDFRLIPRGKTSRYYSSTPLSVCLV